MIEKILEYPKGEKPRSRIDHKNIINDFAIKFGVTSNEKLLLFYTMIYSTNGRTLQPRATRIKLSVERHLELFPDIKYPTTQRGLTLLLFSGTRGNYLSNDGYAYAPKGYLRLNGRNSYRLVDSECRRILGYSFNVEGDPKLLLNPTIGLISALALWSAKCRDSRTIREVTYAFDNSLKNVSKREIVYKRLIKLTE